MWSDTQDQPFAMGLRGTAIKRKLSEQDVGPPAAVAVAAQPQPHLPSKAARADQWGVTDVHTDLGAHHHHQHQHNNHHHQQHQNHHHHHHQQQQHHQQNGYNGGGQQQQQQQQQQQRFYCFDDYRQLQQQQQQQCYEQQQQQQTIRRDENGKSYLELGSWSGRSGSGSGNGRVASSPASRCCEARTNWCVRGPACYRQRRLAVLNISMCKLGRYRQFSDPSLHRSVLICNTLRLIEKEMEQEGYFEAAAANAASNGSNDVTSTAAASTEPQFPEVPVPYEPPRVPTPFPPSSSSASDSSSSSSSSVSSTTSSSSSSSSTSDDDRSINWGSVLSLSSQSDLDPLNNNDCLGGGDSSSSDFNHDLDDFLPAWKAVDRHVSEPSGGELESIMHVLVGT